MEFPFNQGPPSHATHTQHHHRRNDDDESNTYPPPGTGFSSFNNPYPPPPQPPFYGDVAQPETQVFHSSHVTSGHVSNDFNYSAPPPPFSSYHHRVDPPPPSSFDYGHTPPPGSGATVHHVSHESHRPHFPSYVHHVGHQVNTALSNKPTYRVVTKAGPDYALTIRHGQVILAHSDPRDEFQHWYKDEKYSTRVKDKEGCPAFSLVNKVTGEAMKHSIGASHPVQLIPYNPDRLDESILWTESRDLGDGHRAIRMVNNIHLNVDAFHGDKHSGGVHDGTTIVLWDWNNGDNQRWKILPYFVSSRHSASLVILNKVTSTMELRFNNVHHPMRDDNEESENHFPLPSHYYQIDHNFNYSYPSAQVPQITVNHFHNGTHHHHKFTSTSAFLCKPIVRIVTKEAPDYSVTIRDGKVILAPTDPRNEYQLWYKDEKYSTIVKDEEGSPGFSLVNKVTGEAIQHSLATKPVRLIPYPSNHFVESIMWSQGMQNDDGYKALRMTNNFHLNMDAFKDIERYEGVKDGTTIGLWEWLDGDNQKWMIIPY